MTVTKRLAVILLVLSLVLSASAAQAAIVTLEFASFGNGAVVITFDYNTNNGNVTKFTCTNNSAYGARFVVYEDVGGTIVTRYVKLCPANGVTTQNVAGTSLAWDTVDGGLIMGPYQFSAQWPW